MNASFSLTTRKHAAFLVDHDGKKSITNDAEAVVQHVLAAFPNHRIFYQDTQGDWDELVHNGVEFVRFAGISPVTMTKYFS
jgi:hypothetical protein